MSNIKKTSTARLKSQSGASGLIALLALGVGISIIAPGGLGDFLGLGSGAKFWSFMACVAVQTTLSTMVKSRQDEILAREIIAREIIARGSVR